LDTYGDQKTVHSTKEGRLIGLSFLKQIRRIEETLDGVARRKRRRWGQKEAEAIVNVRKLSNLPQNGEVQRKNTANKLSKEITKGRGPTEG